MDLRDVRAAPMSGDREVGGRTKVFADGTTPGVPIHVTPGYPIRVDGYGIFTADGRFLRRVETPPEMFNSPYSTISFDLSRELPSED